MSYRSIRIDAGRLTTYLSSPTRLTGEDKSAFPRKKAAAAVRAVVGDDKIVTAREAKGLPPEMKRQYADYRNEYSWSLGERCAWEGFPDGWLPPQETFINRALAFPRQKLFSDLIAITDAAKSFKKVMKQLESGPMTLADGTTLERLTDPVVDGNPVDVSGGPWLLVSTASARYLVEMGLSYDVTAFAPDESDPTGEASWLPLTTALGARTGSAPGANKEREQLRSITEASVNLSPTELRAVFTALTVAKPERDGRNALQAEVAAACAATERREIALCEEYLRRMGAFAQVKELRGFVKKHGPQELGDGDRTLCIADRFAIEVEEELSDGGTAKREQVQLDGRGPLLISDHNAGPIDWALELDALKDGQLVIHFFCDDEPAGVLRMTERPDDSACTASLNALSHLIFDLDYLPRQLKG